MKSTDMHTEARQSWLRDEQTNRVAPVEATRQSNFEKSKVFRWTIVAALLFVAVNVFQDDPVVVTTIAYHATV